MDLNIKIKRNTSLSFTIFHFDGSRLREALLNCLTEDEKREIAEADRRRADFENKIWENAEKAGLKDLDGDPILKTTHQICYQWNDDGTPAEIAIQPKRSIYDRKT